METSFFSFASPSNQKSFILFIVNIGSTSPSDKTMKVFVPFVAVFLLAVVPASCFGMPPGTSVDDCACKSKTGLANGRAANWAPKVAFSPSYALSSFTSRSRSVAKSAYKSGAGVILRSHKFYNHLLCLLPLPVLYSLTFFLRASHLRQDSEICEEK